MSLKTLIGLVIFSEYLAEISREKVVLFESRATFGALLSFFERSQLFDLLSLRRRVMNHPLFSGLETVILVRLPSTCRSQIRRSERKVPILTEYLLIDLGVSESLITISEINFLKIIVFHVVPLNVSEIQILVELLSILSSLHLSSFLDSSVFELLESVLWK